MVLIKCPVRFYSIFNEIGQNVDGKMYFYHGSLFSSLAPANGYAQKNCAERFSALNVAVFSVSFQSRSQSPRYPYPAERPLDKSNAGSGNEIAFEHERRARALGLETTATLAKF